MKAYKPAGAELASAARKTWRDKIPIHPAAEMFPRMGPVELTGLGNDIKKHGLKVPIVIWVELDDRCSLLDGISRLDAMEAVGIEFELVKDGLFFKIQMRDDGIAPKISEPDYALASMGVDPYELVASLNAHRRHLTCEDKRKAIESLLKANPGKSDRQIAESVKVSHPHVAKIRKEMEKAGDVETVSMSIDKKGRKQPRKKRRQPAKVPEAEQQDLAASATAGEKASRAAAVADDTASKRAPKPTTGLNIVKAWKAAPLDERMRAIGNIGWKELTQAIPEGWIPLIERWVAEHHERENKKDASKTRGDTVGTCATLANALVSGNREPASGDGPDPAGQGPAATPPASPSPAPPMGDDLDTAPKPDTGASTSSPASGSTSGGAAIPELVALEAKYPNPPTNPPLVSPQASS